MWAVIRKKLPERVVEKARLEALRLLQKDLDIVSMEWSLPLRQTPKGYEVFGQTKERANIIARTAESIINYGYETVRNQFEQ